MKVRPGAVVRGVGAAAGCLTRDPAKRPLVLLAAYTGGWFLNRPGLQVLTVVPDSDQPWKRHTVPFATSFASWSAVMLAASTALRRTWLPLPIKAVALGAGVAVADSMLADMAEARAAAAQPRDPA